MSSISTQEKHRRLAYSVYNIQILPLYPSISLWSQDEHREHLGEHLAWADGFLLVYSVSDLQSFYTVSSLVDAIQSSRGNTHRPPYVLVANKVDLPPEARKLSEIQGRRLGTHLNCPYVETSAQENYAGVFQAFMALVHEIRAQQKHDRLRKITKKSHSTISQLRETLRNLTDFRNRTNTFWLLFCYLQICPYHWGFTSIYCSYVKTVNEHTVRELQHIMLESVQE